MNISIHVLIFLIVLASRLGAQVNNDECFAATNITNIEEFCSSGFSNTEAMSEGLPVPNCWGNEDGQSDVWYSFRPVKPGLLLRFFGSGSTTSETLDNVGLALYEGRCTELNEIDCIRRDEGSDDIFERIYTDLTIGRTHYFRISSSSSDAGSFQLCLSEFIPVPEPEQDCNTAVVLCDKSAFVVEKIEGFGQVSDEANGSCLNGLRPDSPINSPVDLTETSSVWYKWTARTSGTLTFTLTPNNDDPEEDLDFAIYRLLGGLDDCLNKELMVCMASGANFLGSGIDDTPCKGPTGLRANDADLVEFAGCDIGDNNFLAPLNISQGESYALIVNNFSRSGFGFSIEFGGTAEFLGPEPDFQFTTVDDFECDKTITFENLSSSATDQIIEYRWSFGEGASPEFMTGEGPHDVVYESFGSKIAVLTIESGRGCLVTKVLELEVASCCDDFSQLTLDPTIEDLTCFESNDGSIRASAINGSPDYLYALDGSEFSPNEIFNGLSIGSFELSAIDVKGCQVSEVLTIMQPEEIRLFLTGPTDTIELGQTTQIFSDFMPNDRILAYQWSPSDGLSCTDCPDPMVIPPGITTYTLRVIDQDGCTQTAEIILLTTDFKPFIAPEIMSLNPSNPENGTFKVSGNIALDQIEFLAIYDRWGGELYREENFELGESSYIGWNGLVRNTGKKVNPGVYVWLAKAIFVDGVKQTFAGTITVID